MTKYKHRSEEEVKDLTMRLRRIEGQVRGIEKMVEEDRYCVDILNQVRAASAALDSFSKELLSAHIHTCVVKDIQDGRLETVDELCETVKRLMK